MSMKFWIKHSTNISLIISVGLHLVLIAIFLPREQEPQDKTLKIPTGHALSLGRLNIKSGPYKINSTANHSTKKTPVASSLTVAKEASTEEEATTAEDNESGGHSNESQTLSAKQKYFVEFRTLVEGKKQYPLLARRRAMEGVVIVAVTIKRSGEVSDHKIIKSSDHSVLDNATLDSIKGIKNFKSFPAEWGETEIEFKLPVAYKLNV